MYNQDILEWNSTFDLLLALLVEPNFFFSLKDQKLVFLTNLLDQNMEHEISWEKCRHIQNFGIDSHFQNYSVLTKIWICFSKKHQIR